MTKRTLLFLLLTLWMITDPGMTLTAQHCPHDHAYILVLKITDGKSDASIPHLKVGIINPGQMMQSVEPGIQFLETDTLFLHQNPAVSSPQGLIDNLHPADYSKTHFFFAADHYVWVGGKPRSTVQVYIESPDEKRYASRVAFIEPAFFFPLCTGLSRWNAESNPSFVAEYKAYEVQLRSIHPSEPLLEGTYVLKNMPGASAERCGYSKIEFKTRNRFVLVDDELPINMWEIPNTSKTYGTYAFTSDSTIRLSCTYRKVKSVRLKRSWIRKLFPYTTHKSTYTEHFLLRFKQDELYPEWNLYDPYCIFYKP